ncbi:ATP-binding protein [Pedobacter changchengzhani]|uniref:ATP-binding protein n=1 Tax=Pedobacter changchengzhani TaxID=2529274 RepID=A0A4R5MNP0_9SPHI|nr:ATP-binding protein [Pedobacter changchengzhani]TDG37407.1 ATP-binding protein [Pedobacter changchengzhani]
MEDQIPRYLSSVIKSKIGKNKVILLFGTRRAGKTWFIENILRETTIEHLFLNGEDQDVQALLASRTAANYKRILGEAKLLVIDEAQVIPEIGKILKLLIDSFKDLTIIASGSSAFDLSNQTGEPLTGRSLTYYLYPIAQLELTTIENGLQTAQNLEERLIFGSYPELFQLNTIAEKTTYLTELVKSYLLKDILMYENIQNSTKLFDLLKLIALQVGSEVSIDELSRNLGLSKNTVDRYLDLLSKVFIIYKVGGYSNNLRKEITKSSKWYFYDNGIRNAIINDFRLLALRNDHGILWENYCFSERIKKTSYQEENTRNYFWRTYDQQEIDFIEVKDEQINAVDFKLANQKKKIPGFFAKNYPNANFTIVNKENYLDFIS